MTSARTRSTLATWLRLSLRIWDGFRPCSRLIAIQRLAGGLDRPGDRALPGSTVCVPALRGGDHGPARGLGPTSVLGWVGVTVAVWVAVVIWVVPPAGPRLGPSPQSTGTTRHPGPVIDHSDGPTGQPLPGRSAKDPRPAARQVGPHRPVGTRRSARRSAAWPSPGRERAESRRARARRPQPGRGAGQPPQQPAAGSSSAAASSAAARPRRAEPVART